MWHLTCTSQASSSAFTYGLTTVSEDASWEIDLKARLSLAENVFCQNI